MDTTFSSRLKHAWNAFLNRAPTKYNTGPGFGYRPDRPRFTSGNERSIINSIFNRIAMDVAAVNIEHCRLDQNGRFMEVIDSGLNNCLTLEANIDQTGRAFMQDVVMSMIDEGCVAIVPIDTDYDIDKTNGYDILSMRTGKIIEWFPHHVKVRVYNDAKGYREELIFNKSDVCIIENPLYAITNEPNSAVQRLIRKLNLLDVIDEQSGSGKLDLIIQLPYSIKTPSKQKFADQRKKEIEDQLTGSKYGIAYIDATEHITQLNRSLDNNLLTQIEYLTTMVYSQLGMTPEIMNGTADEKTMLNYNNRTIEPFVSAIVDEMKRTFLTKTARTQRQTIMSFRDPFRLVPVDNLAEIVDKFTRNEILSTNEVRQIIGMKPVNAPEADELRNKNINAGDNQSFASTIDEENDYTEDEPMTEDEYESAMEELDGLDEQLDDVESSMSHSAFLMHYASPYYDPEKAHEYYMKHRELKGKSSLNTTGKEAAEYVRGMLDEEKQAKLKALAERKESDEKSNSDALSQKLDAMQTKNKADVEAYSDIVKKQIEKLQDLATNMKNKRSVSIQIDALRDKNQKKKAQLTAAYQKSVASEKSASSDRKTSITKKYSDDVQKVKDDYKQRYNEEMNSIYQDKSLEAEKKKKKSKSKKKKSTTSNKSKSTKTTKSSTSKYTTSGSTTTKSSTSSKSTTK